MSEKLKIKLSIANRVYPLTIEANQEREAFKKNGGNLAFWGVGGTYQADLKTSEDEAPDQELFGTQDRDQLFYGNMGTVGLSYSQPIDRNTFFRANVGSSL